MRAIEKHLAQRLVLSHSTKTSRQEFKRGIGRIRELASDDETEGAEDFEGGEDDVLEFIFGGVDAGQERVGRRGMSFLYRSQQSFRFWQITSTGRLKCFFQIF